MTRLAAALVVAVALALAGPAAAATLTGTVSGHVDGDTVKVTSRGFETTVRLIGIDTPETRDPSEPVQCFGPRASARTAALLPLGRAVTLVTDPTQATRDRYDRLLAYIYTGGRTGARGSVNFALVATGYAKVYVYGGVRFEYAVPFFRAQHRARVKKNGLWGPPCNGDTTKPDPGTATGGGGGTTARCDPNYAGACIPPYPPDLDCNQITARNFRVVGEDVDHFDVDHDGIACEQ